MFANVSMLCFAASYAVTLALEISRLFFRVPIRTLVMIGFTTAGLFAQTAYLVTRTQASAASPPLSSWYDWLLLVAWGVALIYLMMTVRRPQTTLGIFMLPLVLLLIGVAKLFRDAAPFPREQSTQVWGFVHGMALLMGAVVVMIGFVFGLMYLVQSYRLKHKLPPRLGFKLPSLELLQNINRQSLVVSSFLLFLGLVSGVALNLVKNAQGVPWSDPVVWTSAVLLLWVVAALLFEYFYKPAQQGRKVAYLTLASFIFLGLVLAIILLVPSEHATANDGPPRTRPLVAIAGVRR